MKSDQSSTKQSPGIAGAVILRFFITSLLLQAELPGYRDYVKTVRRRLVPGIW